MNERTESRISRSAVRTAQLSARPRPPEYDHRFAKLLFTQATAARIMTTLLVAVFAGSIGELSRDSEKFHIEASRIAKEIALGNIEWSQWIDQGWRQFIGLLYFLCGPNLIYVLLVNAVLSGLGAVWLYRLALETFDDEDVARVTAYLFTFFPSVLYYTSLPLREAPAVLGLLFVARGTLHVTYYRNPRHFYEILGGLMIITALRAYLAVVCAAYVLLCLSASKIRGDLWSFLRLGIVGGTCLLAALGILFASGIDLGDYEALKYFDIEHLNHARMKMNSGNAKLFEYKTDAVLGQNPLQDTVNIFRGVWMFFFSVDPTNITRNRQLAALPELVFFLLCIPSLYSGVVTGWRRFPRRILPSLLLCLLIIVIYSAGTTNGGAMYRWRVQALPFLILIIVYGAYVRRVGLLPSMLVRRRVSAVRRMIPARRQPA